MMSTRVDTILADWPEESRNASSRHGITCRDTTQVHVFAPFDQREKEKQTRSASKKPTQVHDKVEM